MGAQLKKRASMALFSCHEYSLLLSLFSLCCFQQNVLVLLTLYCEAYAGVIRLVLIELIILTGQYCIQDNTGQRTYCQSGQADGDLADVECDSACCAVIDTDGQYQDQSGDDNVTALGEVYLSLYDVTNTDC